MKKLLLTVSMCLMAGLQVQAEVGDEFQVNDIKYVVKSDSTVGIAGYKDGATSFQLSETVSYDNKSYTVVSVEEGAFRYSEVPSITLPKTITYIGKQAFGTTQFKHIDLPESLKTIENYAFYGARELTSIEIPEGVSELGTSKAGSAFGSCPKLQSVKLPSTLKVIWDATFFHNSSLKEVVLPSGVTTLGRNAFYNCDSLSHVTLSEGLTVLSDGVFSNCKMLGQIEGISDSIQTIGEEAFLNCPIKEYSISAACTHIGDRAFAGTQIAAFKLSPENTSYTLIDGILYTADKSLLMAYPAYAPQTEVRVAEGCLGINAGAFMGAQLKKVTLPESVVAIGDFAFCYAKVEEVKMTDNVLLVGEQAFAGSSVKNVVLPARIGQMNEATFAGCDSLVSVTIPSQVKTMGIRQFWNCKNLKEVHFLGYYSPEVDYWEYMSEAPFFGIAPKSVKITCPKGRAAAYEVNFGSYEEIASIEDTEKGIIIPSLVTPSHGTDVSILDKLTFNFSEEVTLVENKPAIEVICGEMVANVPVGKAEKVGMWVMNKTSKKEYYAVPLDEYAEGGEPIKMIKGKTYFVTLPAGTFKNAEGLYNEAVTVKYNGVWEKPVLTFTEVEPAAESALKQLENVYITFNDAPHKAYDAASKIKLIEGELVEGVPTGTEVMGNANQWFVNVKDNTVQIFPADYDAYIVPIDLTPGHTYFLVIEANAFFNGEAHNDLIAIPYNGDATGISQTVQTDCYVVKEAGSLSVCLSNQHPATVQLYNAEGRLAGSAAAVSGKATFDGLTPGLYIVKVATAQGVKTLKVVL